MRSTGWGNDGGGRSLIWEFDVRTGQSWFDPRNVRVRRYEDTLGPIPPAGAADANPPAPGLERGPYVAETYDVTVERSQVMVDVPT
jgi:3-phenylpropionate/trans-cinnamate dioxygenase ferredoxin subunit